MKNKKGVSMIALVITIIVVIIIAAVIMIVSGNTVSKAGVSKFKQEISDYDYEVKATAKQVKMEEVLGRDVISEREAYFATATGLEPTDDDEMYARFRTEIDRMILPEDLKDDVFYQILTTTKVSAKQTMKDQIYYVTEGGEVFVLPGYYEKQDNDTTVWWINANLYYEGEFPFELPNTITPPKPKPAAPTITVTENDMSGTEVSSNGVTKENVYVLVKAKAEGDTINVAVVKDGSPYSVSQDGNGGFSLTEEGEFIIVATSQNDEGTNSDEVKFKVTINRVAPGAPTITANIESVAGAAIETNGLTNKNVAVTITKSADAESTPLIMTKNDVEILSVENAEDGYMLSEDGVYVITTKSLDKLKNESSPATFVVTIDKVAPSAPTIVAMMGETAILNDGVAGQDVTITVTPASDANTTEVIIKKDGVELSKSSTLSRKLTDEGVYTITATSEDLAKNKSSQSIFVVTINKAGPDAPVITGIVDGSDFASGGETTKNVAITVTPSLEANATEVVITKDDAEISRSGALSYNLTDSGKYVVSAVSQDIYGNSSSVVTYEVTIKSKIVPTVTAPTAKTLTYNGNEQELVKAGSVTEGTLEYALSTATTNNGTFGANVPKATNAGTYYVFYRQNGTTDQTKYVTCTIAKATGSGSVTIEDWSTGDSVKPSPVPVSSTNGTSNVTYKYKKTSQADSKYTTTRPTSAGDYTLQATFAETQNYKAVVATTTFTIEQSDEYGNNPDYFFIEGEKVYTDGSLSERFGSTFEEGEIIYYDGKYYVVVKDFNTQSFGVITGAIALAKCITNCEKINIDKGFVPRDSAEEGDLVKDPDGSIYVCTKVETERVKVGGTTLFPVYETRVKDRVFEKVQ